MNLFDRLFAKTIKRHVALAVKALDDARDRLLTQSGTYPRDRYTYDRRDVLERSLEAWRENPLARRIVSLTTQYIIGSGVTIECKHTATHNFIQEFWTHPLNNLDIRTREWCDELTRSGDLFILLSTDPSGMTYTRAIPSIQVQDIDTADNDIEQETTFHVLEGQSLLEARPYPAFNLSTPLNQPSIMHFAINRPVGALFGESDLAPMLKWLTRYAAWLEDRVRLNRFRQVFNYVVRGKYNSKADRLARQAELNANPPSPGSILVCDTEEEWDVIHPKLDTFEAMQDGLAIKKFIAVGCGVPLHFLAEPESATRTTAEAAGGPTYRHFEQRQEFFMWLIESVALVAIHNRNLVYHNLPNHPQLKVHAADISGRDNASLASAANQAVAAFSQLYRIQAIDKAELLRLAYRFAGEVVNVEDMLARASQETPTLDPVPNIQPPIKDPYGQRI
jgi:hypothetical protein